MSRRLLLTIAKLALAAGLVWYVIYLAGWENLKSNLSRMDMSDWVLSLAVMTVAYLISMVRWRMLMGSVGIPATLWDAIRLGFVGAFFNNVMPGMTGGDLVKAFYVAREYPSKRADAVLTVVVDRVVGIVALALIAAVVIPFDFDRYRDAALGIYGFLAVSGVGAAVSLSRRIKARLKSALRLPPGGGEGRVGRLLSRIDRAVSIYRERLGALANALVLGVVVHMLIIVSIWILAGAIAKGNLASLPADAPPAGRAEYVAFGQLGLDVHCSIVPIVMIISALPIAPAGWGVGDVAFNYFYGEAGVPDELAVALSIAYRLTAMLLSLVGAVFLLLDRKRVLSAAKEGA